MPGITGGQRLAGIDVLWALDLGDYVISVAPSPGGEWIAAAGTEGPVRVFETGNGSELYRYEGHKWGNLALDWSVCGRFLASAGQDGRVEIRDALSGVPISEFHTGSGWVEHIAWSPVSPLLAAASGRELGVWEPGGGLRTKFKPHGGAVAGIAWRRDGSRLASIARGELRVWSPSDETPVTEHAWDDAMISLAWSPDGGTIACGCQGDSVHVWNPGSGEALLMSGYPEKVRALAWDSAGLLLATGGSDMVTCWKFRGRGPKGTKPVTLDFHDDLVTHLAFRPGCGRLASGARDGWIVLWNPPNNKPERGYPGGAAVSVLRWIGKGGALAAGFEDGRLVLYRIPEEGPAR